MMYGFNHGWGMMNMGTGWVFDMIFLGLLIWLIIIITNRNKGNTQQSKNNSALDILKERYAKGEIGKEEFEEKKKDLT